MTPEQNLRMAAQLYAQRAAARRLLGDRFWPFMDQLKAGIQQRAAATCKSTLQAAIAAAHAMPEHTTFIFAAFVEIEDPTPRPAAPPAPAHPPEGP